MKPNQKKVVKKGFKPVSVSLPVVFTGLDQKGNTYDVDSCKTIINDLQDSGCFDKLSVSVVIARNRVIDENAKGSLNLARLIKFNKETEEFELLLLGKNTEYADFLNAYSYVIVPRVLTAKAKNDETPSVSSIIGFEIVPAMEA